MPIPSTLCGCWCLQKWLPLWPKGGQDPRSLWLPSSSHLPQEFSWGIFPRQDFILLALEGHFFSRSSVAGGLQMPSLRLPSGIAMTVGVLVPGGFCPSGCPAQSVYVLFQEIDGLQCSLMCLPSLGEGLVVWVFAPYPSPPRGFGLAAGPHNASSTPLCFLFRPGRTPPLPHPFFKGSTDFLIKGPHSLWSKWWGPSDLFSWYASL